MTGNRALAVGMTAILATVGTPPPAHALCHTHEIVEDRLAQYYHETHKLQGRTAKDYVIDVFASDGFGTWTMTLRADEGPTCLIASGKGRSALDDELAAFR